MDVQSRKKMNGFDDENHEKHWEEVEDLIRQINRRMSAKEAYALQKEVLDFLHNPKVLEDQKRKLYDEALLEPLAMLASCYENPE